MRLTWSSHGLADKLNLRRPPTPSSRSASGRDDFESVGHPGVLAGLAATGRRTTRRGICWCAARRKVVRETPFKPSACAFARSAASALLRPRFPPTFSKKSPGLLVGSGSRSTATEIPAPPPLTGSAQHRRARRVAARVDEPIPFYQSRSKDPPQVRRSTIFGARLLPLPLPFSTQFPRSRTAQRAPARARRVQRASLTCSPLPPWPLNPDPSSGATRASPCEPQASHSALAPRPPRSCLPAGDRAKGGARASPRPRGPSVPFGDHGL